MNSYQRVIAMFNGLEIPYEVTHRQNDTTTIKTENAMLYFDRYDRLVKTTYKVFTV